MPNPNFTIVVPVRNGANYISAAISSVLSQTYPHFRILILENASTDNTLQIVEKFGNERIDVVPAPKPLNIQENWGRIIEQSTNEYITFMGHDDLLYPDFLKEMASLITSEPSASLYQAQFEEIDSNGSAVRHPATVAYKETASQFLAAIMGGKEEFCGTGYVMRAADYRDIGGIPNFPGLLYADLVLWYRLANLSYKVCSPKTLVGYRVHAQGMHRYANFSQYYLATRQYYEFLCTSTDLKDNTTAAHNYIDRQIQLNYRTAIVKAIVSPDEGIPQLQMARQQIAEDGLFTLHDYAARVYETFIAMPIWLRQIALLPVTWRRAFLRLRSNH